MKITGPNQYEVVDGEVIRVTVEAVVIPYNASYGPHTNGALWTITQHATAQIPKQIQEFTVPKSDGRFEITYGFGPAPADGAHYLRTVESGGVVDGPFRVRVIEGFSNVKGGVKLDQWGGEKADHSTGWMGLSLKDLRGWLERRPATRVAGRV